MFFKVHRDWTLLVDLYEPFDRRGMEIKNILNWKTYLYNYIWKEAHMQSTLYWLVFKA